MTCSKRRCSSLLSAHRCPSPWQPGRWLIPGHGRPPGLGGDSDRLGTAMIFAGNSTAPHGLAAGPAEAHGLSTICSRASPKVSTLGLPGHCTWVGGNLPSVRCHPALVDRHIQEERAAGRLLGSLPPELAGDCQVSPIGLIPKPHKPGKWRLPHGRSVNDAISSPSSPHVTAASSSAL